MFKKILLFIISFSFLLWFYSNTFANDTSDLKISINHILNNTNDKVFVSKMYYNHQKEKCMIIVTKNYQGDYTLNYLRFNNLTLTFNTVREYHLYNKNFYQKNLFIFDNNFLYIESGDNWKVYFYDNKRKYILDKSRINQLFNTDTLWTDKSWNPIYYWIHIINNVVSNNNSIWVYKNYSFQTTNNIRNLLLGNTWYIWTNKKNMNLYYQNWTFFFYNINLTRSTVQPVINSNVPTNFVFSQKISQFWYKNIFCKWKSHNFLLIFNLKYQAVNIFPLEKIDEQGNKTRDCYYDRQNMSLLSKAIWAWINKTHWLLMYETADNSNNDNFLKIYSLDVVNWRIVANERYQTKVIDQMPINPNMILDQNYKYKYYNNRKYTNLYENSNFIAFYYKKNVYNTLLIENKHTWAVTEFKDILKLKKISSNSFDWKANLVIAYYKKLSWIEKLEVSKIDTDNVVTSLATMSKSSKLSYLHHWIFTNIFSIVNPNLLYYKYLWYYNITWHLVTTKNNQFFLDYKIDGNKFINFILNKQNYTSKINQFLSTYLIKWLNITSINYLKLLDDGYTQINFTYNKEETTYTTQKDPKTHKLKKIPHTKKIKWEKNILFTLSSFIELPELKDWLQKIIVFPKNEKILAIYKNKIFLIDINNKASHEIPLSTNNDIIDTLKWWESSINFIWLKQNSISKPIINYYNWNIYILTVNGVQKIDVENWNIENIIDGNIQKFYDYNWHIIIYNMDNMWKNNIYIDYKKIISWSYLWLRIYNNMMLLFNKKDILVILIKKRLEMDKIIKFNTVIDKYILSLNNPVTLYYYNLFKDVLYKLNNVVADKSIIMNLFYRYYINSKNAK